MGKLHAAQAEPAPHGARHEFTVLERQRGREASARRARRRQEAAARLSRRLREWMATDARLWDAYQQAQPFGTPRQVSKCKAAWLRHQASMPVQGRAV